MSTPNGNVTDKLLSRQTRVYVYGIAIAAAPILVAANLITGDEVDLWLNLLASALLLGSSSLAVANVPSKE